MVLLETEIRAFLTTESCIGGGYGLGNGRQNLSTIINTNNNSFVGVAIQYRVSISPAKVV